MFFALFTALFWGISTVSGSRAAGYLGGSLAHFYRLIIAMAILALYAKFFGQWLAGPGLFLFILSGILGIGLGDLAAFHSFLRLGPRLTSLFVQCLATPFAALIEWIWLGTTLSFHQMLGITIILIGTTLSLIPGVVLPRGTAVLDIRKARLLIAIGVLLSVSAAFVQSVGAVLTRKAYEVNLAQDIHIDGMTAAFQRLVGALLIMFIIQTLTTGVSKHFRPDRKDSSFIKSLPWVGANALTGMVLGMACFQWALQSTPTAIVLSIVALTPLIVIPISWVINKDKPAVLSIIGGFIAVGGVIYLISS